MNKNDAYKFLQIERILPVITTRKRIRRGLLHKTVCKTLGLTLNNHNVKLIKIALQKYNPREVRIRGLQYYSLGDCDVEGLHT